MKCRILVHSKTIITNGLKIIPCPIFICLPVISGGGSPECRREGKDGWMG